MIAVGLAVMDQIFGVEAIPGEPTKVFARSYTEVGGGPAATASVTIARLGGAAELWSRVGADAVGERIVAELVGHGVEPQVRVVPGARSNLSGVLVDGRGERLIVSFTDPLLDVAAGWLPLERIADADAVLADVRWPQASAAALAEARRRDRPTVLDADLAPHDVTRALLPLADHTVFSKPALKALTDIEDPALALRRVRGMGAGLVGVTLGEGGFLWLDGDSPSLVPGFPIDAVDTLGAGDVFHGAYVLAIAEGHGVAQAARFANAAAALKCTRPGGRAGIPDRVEVERLLDAR